MKVVKLIDITMSSTTVAQAANDNFTMAGSWDAGNKVYVINEDDDSTPVYPVEVYSSVGDANSGNYPPDNLDKWTLVGVSNRWEMFDGYVNTQTDDTSDIKVEIDSSDTNKIGLFNLQGSDVTLVQIINTELATGGDVKTDDFTKGTGWTYNDGADTYDCSGAQVADSELHQDAGTVDGNKYIVYFTVSGFVGGKIAGLAGGVEGTDVAADGDYAQVITAGATDHDGLIADEDFEGSVTDISIMRVSNNETTEIDLDNSFTPDYWYYFFSDFTFRTDISWEYSFFANSKIRIEITTQGGTSACGMVALGRATTLGTTLYEPKIGIVDYSIKATDILGRTYLDQGAFAKTNEIDFWIQNIHLDLVYQALVNVRGEAAIFDANTDSTDYESLVVYGFWKNFDIVVPAPDYSRVALEVEGLI